MIRRASIPAAAIFFSVLLAGCSKDQEKLSDGELGLNAQQAQGRHLYQIYCANCHSPYSSEPRKAFSLKGLYKKQYLPSGLIANDRFVEQSIVHGRNMMPPFGNVLSEQELNDLVAYLHTL